MNSALRSVRAPILVLVALAAIALPRAARAATSCEELVRSGRAHEAAGEPEVALRRYTEAVTLDATCGPAYLGLGSLRLRMGDAREAEHVSDVALEHVPALRGAFELRARARWAQGRQDDAESDMLAYAERASDPRQTVAALVELAAWYDKTRRVPAELACWRRILATVPPDDAAMVARARTMVRALEIFLGPADPVTSPSRRDLVRSVVAAAAR